MKTRSLPRMEFYHRIPFNILSCFISKKNIYYLPFLILFLAFFKVYGQGEVPEPVDLGIENRMQLQTSWCWAAAAEQVIYWSAGVDVPQCELVARANNADPNYCCAYPYLCNVAGFMQQIQGLVYAYGGHYSSISPPQDAMSVYRTLSKGRAIILFLQTTPYIGHFVVLRGMEWQETETGTIPVFYINDPMSYFVEPVPFKQLLTIWRAGIVVY